jgi:drug/metabolite transporter (DMT)-like permease
MTWAGLLLLVAGGALALVTDGEARGAGAAAAVVGALLLVAGILRLRRTRRRANRPYAVDQPYRTGKGKIAAMILAVVYILSPIDIIPDPLLPVGVVDDATALTWLIFALGQEAVRRRRSAP